MSVSTRLSFVIAVLLLLMLSAADVQAQAGRCRPCEIAQERCSASCLGRDDKDQIGSCLIGCENAATRCSCDEPATLSAEEYVERFGLKVVTEFSAACHSTTPCGSEYGACTNWSSYSDCDDPFCHQVNGCAEECGPLSCFGPGMRQRQERYRVCFNAIGQSCTEYQRTVINLSCDC